MAKYVCALMYTFIKQFKNNKNMYHNNNDENLYYKKLILKFGFLLNNSKFFLISSFSSAPSLSICLCTRITSRRVYQENNTKQYKYLLASAKHISKNNILRPVLKNFHNSLTRIHKEKV